jgi:peptide/nickel transport system substrate-binding protein
VTADDVRFTWRAQTSPEVAWIGRENKARIVDVEAPDARTAIFRFDRSYPEQLVDAVDGGIVPEHVFGRVPFAQWRTHDWSRARVVSGPFALAAHRPGESIVLARNARYFRAGYPRVDEVAFRIVPDAGSLVTQLLAGGLDWLDGVPPQDAARVAAAPGVKLLAYDVAGFDYVGWNGRKAPFDDPQVRRALTLALDRKAIVEEVLYGFGRAAAGPVPSSWWCADPALLPWPYDPAEARRLLAARGFGKEHPLTFEIATNAGNRQREAVLVKLQEQWARVGIVAQPLVLEMKALRERSAAGALDAWLGGWRFSGKADLATIFGSSAVPPAGSNVAYYRSPEADGLLAALTSAPDAAAARAAYAAVGRVLHRDQPYAFLYEPRRIAAAGPRVLDAALDTPSDPLAGLERFSLAR